MKLREAPWCAPWKPRSLHVYTSALQQRHRLRDSALAQERLCRALRRLLYAPLLAEHAVWSPRGKAYICVCIRFSTPTAHNLTDTGAAVLAL